MKTYIALIDLTEKGMQSIHESPARADAYKRSAESRGLEIVDIYWTAGGHDGVLILRAPDDTSASAALLALARDGNVHTHMLRAYNRAEFEQVLAKTK